MKPERVTARKRPAKARKGKKPPVKLDTEPPWAMVEALVAQAHQVIAEKQQPKRVTASRPTARRRRS